MYGWGKRALVSGLHAHICCRSIHDVCTSSSSSSPPFLSYIFLLAIAESRLWYFGHVRPRVLCVRQCVHECNIYRPYTFAVRKTLGKKPATTWQGGPAGNNNNVNTRVLYMRICVINIYKGDGQICMIGKNWNTAGHSKVADGAGGPRFGLHHGPAAGRSMGPPGNGSYLYTLYFISYITRLILLLSTPRHRCALFRLILFR